MLPAKYSLGCWMYSGRCNGREKQLCGCAWQPSGKEADGGCVTLVKCFCMSICKYIEWGIWGEVIKVFLLVLMNLHIKDVDGYM